MQFSTKKIAALIAVIAVLLLPVTLLLHRSATWGPAEHTADVLHRLAGEIIENDLSESEIIELLKSRASKDEAIHEYHIDIEKRPDELIWFAPNDRYSVGLSKNGAVIWMVDGKRSDEH